MMYATLNCLSWRKKTSLGVDFCLEAQKCSMWGKKMQIDIGSVLKIDPANPLFWGPITTWLILRHVFFSWGLLKTPLYVFCEQKQR